MANANIPAVTLTAFVNSVAVSVFQETLDRTWDVGSRGILTINVRSLRPSRRQNVTVWANSEVFFGGTILRVEEAGSPREAGVFEAEIVAADYHELADRQWVDVDLASLTAGGAFSILVNSHLTPSYGVTVSSLTDAGPMLSALTYDHQQLTTVFNDLRNATAGMLWTVDENKVARLSSPGTTVAPFSLCNSPGMTQGDVAVLYDAQTYANKITVKAGMDGAVLSRDQLWWGNGVNSIWTTDFETVDPKPVHAWINSGPLNLGTVGVDDPALYWVWDRATHQMRCNTAVPASTCLGVTYNALFPYWAEANSIGSEEVYHRVYAAPDVYDKTAADVLALAYLTRDRADPTAIEFDTMRLGLKPGQAFPVSLTARNVTGTFLVESVETSGVGNQRLLTHVQAVTGANAVRWLDTYRAWGGTGGAGVAMTIGAVTIGAASEHIAPIFLGGSSSEGVTGTAAAWYPIVHQVYAYLRDSRFPGGVATVRVLVKNETGGSVVARLYNYTTSAAVGTSASSSATTWTELSFTATLTAGLNKYGVELQIGTTGVVLYAVATMGSE
jgi:hypothetical protein